MKKVKEKENCHQTMIQTDLFGISITPEDYVTVPVVGDPHSITFAEGWHQSLDKAPMYVSHHHIPPTCENELWQSSWKTQILDLSSEFTLKSYSCLVCLI